LQHLSSARVKAGGADDAPADSTAAGFAAQGRIPAQSLSLEVKGVGPIASALTGAQAQQLHQASRPARYGQGERTLLDTAVRHTGEIPAEAVTLDWPAPARGALLREVAAALGSSPLEARLHALLVYGPGQFFKPHQDTEKHDGMVGTLVLVWPSAHIGGQLTVRHHDGAFAFSSQQLAAGDVRWCAFYADCRHEVLPVEEGWRVSLTFDLVVADTARLGDDEALPDAALQGLLRDEFGLDGEPSVRPWALLLEHEYTEHGLRWHLLKGPDRERVTALRAAAESLGLSVHLALAELHQIFSASGDGWSRHGTRVDRPEPEELIDSSLTLDHWVDADGLVGPRRALHVDEEQLHGFSDTDEAYLVDEEYEGYMGNWGETLEYWYRRAALVIQSPAGAERSRFRIEPMAVLRELQALARQAGQAAVTGEVPASQITGPVEELRARLSGLRDLLLTDRTPIAPAWLEPCADIATVLPDAEQAHALMRRFDPAGFTPADVETLVRLQHGRGADWLTNLWAAWIQRGSQQVDGWPQPVVSDAEPGPQGLPTADRSGLWPEPLADFVLEGLRVGLAPSLLQRAVGEWAFDALCRADERRAAWTPARRGKALERVRGQATTLARAMRALPEPDSPLQRLLEHVAACPSLYPPTELAPFVEAAGKWAARWPAQTPLRAKVLGALREGVAQALRDPDDHTLRGVEWTCACTDCQSVRRWAESPTAQPLVLAIAEARRRHVTEHLRHAAAPLTGETIRQGSPHKLRLDKPSDLHLRDRHRRECWQAALIGLGGDEVG
jgi:hypothetical protein